MSWARLSHLEDTGPTPSWSTNTLATAWLGRKVRKKKKRTLITPKQRVKAKLNRKNSHKETHTHKLIKRKTNKKAKQTNKIPKNKRTDKTLVQIVKANLNRQKSQKETYTHTLTKKEKKGKYKRKRVSKPIIKSTNDNKH